LHVLTDAALAIAANSAVRPRVVNGPHFEARIRPEPDIYFWSPI